MEFDWESYEEEYETRILQRSIFLQKALNFFKSQSSNVDIIPEASEIISTLYFAVKTKHVQEFIPERMNKFKMAALTSFCIIKAQPLINSNLSQNELRKLNAKMAMACAIAIINDMHVDKDTTLPLLDEIESIGNVGIEESIKIQLQNKEMWLAVKNVNMFPIFATGAFLHMVWLYSSFRLHHTGVTH